MKLLSKLNTRYISFSLSAMVASGVLMFVIITHVVNQELDEELTGISHRISKMLTASNETNNIEPFLRIYRVKNATESSSFSDTLVRNEAENEMEEFRQLTVTKKINSAYYKIVIRESKLESKDLIETLAGITLLAILFLTTTLIFINKKVANSIWKPFFKNLKIIGKFSVAEQSSVNLEQTGITEFDTLNDVLTRLTGQIISDFQNLKQFSENASHEIQTPLAIISAKLENLQNDPSLTEKQFTIIRSIQNSVLRLSKLNQGLILLSKIENNQFFEVEPINLQKIIQGKLAEFQELLELQKITVETQWSDDFTIKSNLMLAELLINNLISNSINHNSPDGLIRIIQKENSLEIYNTGRTEIMHPERLFSRFYKENVSSKSVGLGLAIVHKICEMQKWQISYARLDDSHCFRIVFNA